MRNPFISLNYIQKQLTKNFDAQLSMLLREEREAFINVDHIITISDKNLINGDGYKEQYFYIIYMSNDIKYFIYESEYIKLLEFLKNYGKE